MMRQLTSQLPNREEDTVAHPVGGLSDAACKESTKLYVKLPGPWPQTVRQA
jgi:hypothetical protein